EIFVIDRTLILVIARMSATIGDRLVLQVAFAALIADRAIERVVDEQKLHHPFARLLDHWRVGLDRLALGGGQRAARLRLGRPELGAVITDQALDRPGGRIAEGADGVAFDLLGDVIEPVDVADGRVAFAEPLHRPPHPAGAFAARRALAAALMLVEIADTTDR